MLSERELPMNRGIKQGISRDRLNLWRSGFIFDLFAAKFSRPAPWREAGLMGVVQKG